MYLSSNIPHFKCWVRKEFTNNHQEYKGEYLHALAIAVNTIPDRCLSFNIVFTGNYDFAGVDAICGPYPMIHIINTGEGTGTHFGVYGVEAPFGTGAAIYAAGDQIASGTKSAVMNTSQGEKLMYAVEATEVWFEHIGDTRLSNGRTHVELDPMFLETVDIDANNPIKEINNISYYEDGNELASDLTQLNLIVPEGVEGHSGVVRHCTGERSSQYDRPGGGPVCRGRHLQLVRQHHPAGRGGGGQSRGVDGPGGEDQAWRVRPAGVGLE